MAIGASEDVVLEVMGTNLKEKAAAEHNISLSCQRF